LETAATIVTKAAASGIPYLYEWGGMVTLLVLIVALAVAAIIGLAWVIWQMYKNNQAMFKEAIDSANRGTNAIEKLTEYIKGGK
jgi:Flp pilus assembly protein TadB